MGLSPLCPTSASDLHVSTAADLHQVFTRLRPGQAKITIFRVTLDMQNSSPVRLTWQRPLVQCVTTSKGSCSEQHHFHCASDPEVNGVVTIRLAYPVVSMVRVSRRVDGRSASRLRCRLVTLTECAANHTRYTQENPGVPSDGGEPSAEP